MLQHITESKLSQVVFVTGDQKDDWWLIDGAKTMGPRPELVQEVLQAMPEDGCFWMYSTEQFVTYATQYLKSPVTQEAINQVREASATFDVALTERYQDEVHSEHDAEREKRRAMREAERLQVSEAVQPWLVRNYPGCNVTWFASGRAPADFLVQLRDGLWGIGVRSVPNVLIAPGLQNIIQRIRRDTERKSLAHFTIVIPQFSEQSGRKAKAFFKQLSNIVADARISIILAEIAESGLRIVAISGALPTPPTTQAGA